jgi:hypothetical protein
MHLLRALHQFALKQVRPVEQQYGNAPLRALRTRTPVPAWARRAVGEGGVSKLSVGRPSQIFMKRC